MVEPEPRICGMVLACDVHVDTKWHKYLCLWTLTVKASLQRDSRLKCDSTSLGERKTERMAMMEAFPERP